MQTSPTISGRIADRSVWRCDSVPRAAFSWALALRGDNFHGKVNVRCSFGAMAPTPINLRRFPRRGRCGSTPPRILPGGDFSRLANAAFDAQRSDVGLIGRRGALREAHVMSASRAHGGAFEDGLLAVRARRVALGCPGGRHSSAALLSELLLNPSRLGQRLGFFPAEVGLAAHAGAGSDGQQAGLDIANHDRGRQQVD